jgi:hypothetical protein
MIAQIIILAAFIFIIFLQAVIHYAERRDLYNRIMSRNLTEYKGDKVISPRSAHDRVVNNWLGKKDGDK